MRISMIVAAIIGACAPMQGAISAPACLKALVPLAAGSIPVSTDFERTDCGAEKIAAAFRYDRASRSTHAARAIAAAEIVPVYPEFGVDMVLPGQTLQLVIASGATRIERQVTAMQPARQGEQLFVRSSDGQILSVRYEGGAQ